jgi:hypothetical protein
LNASLTKEMLLTEGTGAIAFKKKDAHAVSEPLAAAVAAAVPPLQSQPDTEIANA